LIGRFFFRFHVSDDLTIGELSEIMKFKINAKLPSVSFDFEGETGRNYLVKYRLTNERGAAKVGTIRLPASSGGRSTIFLPVEEVAGSPGNHTFKVLSLVSDDMSHVLELADGSRNYPEIANVHRGGAYDFPSKLKGQLTMVAPK
jgi:hypothetical protein